MEQGARSFTDFVKNVSTSDLFACLALWMEESPLANTCLYDSESSTATSNEDDHGGVKPFINEFVHGPARKKLKGYNCSSKSVGQEFMRNISSPKYINAPSMAAESGCDGAREEKQAAPYCEMVQNGTNGHDEKEPLVKASRSKLNKIGVVMVDANGKILAVECSRDYVHGVTSVLIDFCDRANNCVIYVSRKPCSFCTKLMIQAGISKVYYFPFEPELPDQQDLENADKLLRMSSIGQSIYIPTIQKSMLFDTEVKRSPYTTNKFNHFSPTFYLVSRYWSEQWKCELSLKLNWPEFNDCIKQVEQSIHIMLEWLARVTFGDLPDSVSFHSCDEGTTNHVGAVSEYFRDDVGDDEGIPVIPDPNNPRWQQLARHLSRMANILAQRSDDPKRGVGAIILQRNKIVSTSWNGYPSGAGYGDFPRASHSDGPSLAKKYPFSIHAEQAAILGRNCRDVRDISSTLFVSKTPCDECMPLILKAGIKNVVFPQDTLKRESAFLNYLLIKKCVASGKLKGFHSRVADLSQSAQRQLCFSGVEPLREKNETSRAES